MQKIGIKHDNTFSYFMINKQINGPDKIILLSFPHQNFPPSPCCLSHFPIQLHHLPPPSHRSNFIFFNDQWRTYKTIMCFSSVTECGNHSIWIHSKAYFFLLFPFQSVMDSLHCDLSKLCHDRCKLQISNIIHYCYTGLS